MMYKTALADLNSTISEYLPKHGIATLVTTGTIVQHEMTSVR